MPFEAHRSVHLRAVKEQEVKHNDREIVAAMQTALERRLGADRFAAWFGGDLRWEISESTLLIPVANRFYQEWLAATFRSEIKAACEEVCGRALALEFRCVPAANVAAIDKTNSPSQDRPAAVAPSSPSAPSKRATVQRTVQLGSFVVGPCNRLAHVSAQSVLEKPGTLSPLVLHGPTGVGKTHLLEAICHAARSGPRPSQAVYLTAEQFTTDFLDALRGSGLPSFRRKYRGVQLLAIDDLQFFVNKRATLTELLHTLDTLQREGRQLVLAADRPPEQLVGFAAELTTRLQGGLVCGLEPPDEETRRGILQQLAEEAGCPLPQDVVELLASQLNSHARELVGALKRLQLQARVQGRSANREMAQQVAAEMLRAGQRAVRLTDVERAVCETLGLSNSALHSQRTAQGLSATRSLAMWLARKHTRAALSDISEFFGRKSHTCVIAANKKIDAWLTQDETLHFAGRTWKVQDAVAQIERRLLA